MMWTDLQVKAGLGVMSLIPYFLMRGMIRPAPGLGGIDRLLPTGN
jgi:hypothetical protein